MQLSLEPVDLDDVIDEASTSSAPSPTERVISIPAERRPTSACYVLADRQRLQAGPAQPASNAVKYNRTGGTVDARCASSGRHRVRIAVVRHRHRHARAEMLARLFTPFERLGAETPTIEGTGVGLALSRRLAEAMGGTLDVSTSTIGDGSTFSLELPAERPVDARRHGADGPMPATAAGWDEPSRCSPSRTTSPTSDCGAGPPAPTTSSSSPPSRAPRARLARQHRPI